MNAAEQQRLDALVQIALARGVTVAQAAWLLTQIAPAAMATQTELWIDFVNGNDNASGAAGAPIKTHAELYKRLRAYPITVATLDVRYATAYPPATDPLRIDLNVIQRPSGGQGPLITFHGLARPVKSSGVFTAVTARNRALNTPYMVTDGVVDTSGDVYLRIRITGGARAGAETWVARSTGAGQRRTGEWGIWDVLFGGFPVVPQIGDPYEVLNSAGTVYLDYIRILGGATSGFPNQARITFQDFDIEAYGGALATPWVENIGTQLTFNDCRFSAADNITVRTYAGTNNSAFTYFLNCCATNTFGEIHFQAGPHVINYVDGGVYNLLDAISGAGVTLDLDVLLQGALGTIAAADRGTVVICAAGVMDSAVRCVLVQDATIICTTGGIYNTGGFLWGATAVGGTIGVDVVDGGRVRARTPNRLTLTAAVAELRVGGVNSTWAAYQGAGFISAPTADALIYTSTGLAQPP